jgi:hypothetical protein
MSLLPQLEFYVQKCIKPKDPYFSIIQPPAAPTLQIETEPALVIFSPCRHRQPVNIKVKAETWYFCNRCRCHRIIARRGALKEEDGQNI